MTPEERYARLAELRENGDYVVIVARVDNGRVLFTRPGSTLRAHTTARGQALADLELQTGLSAIDHAALNEREGEPLTTFLERFK